MSDTTDRLGLALLAAGQSQKEVTHNEALLQIDMLVQAVVVNAGLTAPPEAPGAGQCWIVGRAALGAWQGRDDALAGWTAGGWRFWPPTEGALVWNSATLRPLRFTAGRWTDVVDAGALRVGGKQVVGAQQPAILAPSGGTNPDVQARSAISAIIAVLQAHGLVSN
ncbi:MAG: DUF2793 domain-containing protein [Chakrabartia sp.]